MANSIANRPSFSLAWQAAQRIHNPVNPGGHVAKLVGGKVAHNIETPGPAQWKNFCAVRMSYILNKSGPIIPYSGNDTVSGADKQWYFFRVSKLIAFLKQRWGKPDLIVPYPPSGGGELKGKKGIILFEVRGWSDAEGHATVFDGTRCYDHCYFTESEANYRTTKANFWALK